jgi:hypothetical protein
MGKFYEHSGNGPTSRVLWIVCEIDNDMLIFELGPVRNWRDLMYRVRSKIREVWRSIIFNVWTPSLIHILLVIGLKRQAISVFKRRYCKTSCQYYLFDPQDKERKRFHNLFRFYRVPRFHPGRWLKSLLTGVYYKQLMRPLKEMARQRRCRRNLDRKLKAHREAMAKKDA